MSTMVRDAYHSADWTRIGTQEIDRVRVEMRQKDAVTIGVLPRADFLAAVQSELNVRLVSADAIVVERSELPAVERKGKGRYRFDTGIDLTLDPDDDTADRSRLVALEHLALAEYLDANPPIDEAQVSALTDLLITDEPEYAGTTARRLYLAGVRVVTP